MAYRKPGYIEQLWYVFKGAVRSWFEWQDAKCWAKDIHPAWVYLATNARHEETRMIYRNKILKAYRGE